MLPCVSLKGVWESLQGEATEMVLPWRLPHRRERLQQAGVPSPAAWLSVRATDDCSRDSLLQESANKRPPGLACHLHSPHVSNRLCITLLAQKLALVCIETPAGPTSCNIQSLLHRICSCCGKRLQICQSSSSHLRQACVSAEGQEERACVDSQSRAFLEGAASSSLNCCTQLALPSASTGSSLDGPFIPLSCSGVSCCCCSCS